MCLCEIEVNEIQCFYFRHAFSLPQGIASIVRIAMVLCQIVLQGIVRSDSRLFKDFSPSNCVARPIGDSTARGQYRQRQIKRVRNDSDGQLGKASAKR